MTTPSIRTASTTSKTMRGVLRTFWNSLVDYPNLWFGGSIAIANCHQSQIPSVLEPGGDRLCLVEHRSNRPSSFRRKRSRSVARSWPTAKYTVDLINPRRFGTDQRRGEDVQERGGQRRRADRQTCRSSGSTSWPMSTDRSSGVGSGPDPTCPFGPSRSRSGQRHCGGNEERKLEAASAWRCPRHLENRSGTYGSKACCELGSLRCARPAVGKPNTARPTRRPRACTCRRASDRRVRRVPGARSLLVAGGWRPDLRRDPGQRRVRDPRPRARRTRPGGSVPGGLKVPNGLALRTAPARGEQHRIISLDPGGAHGRAAPGRAPGPDTTAGATPAPARRQALRRGRRALQYLRGRPASRARSSGCARTATARDLRPGHPQLGRLRLAPADRRAVLHRQWRRPPRRPDSAGRAEPRPRRAACTSAFPMSTATACPTRSSPARRRRSRRRRPRSRSRPTSRRSASTSTPAPCSPRISERRLRRRARLLEPLRRRSATGSCGSASTPRAAEPAGGVHRRLARRRRQPRGRPVDLEELPDGSLLISDDLAGLVYRVTYRGN